MGRVRLEKVHLARRHGFSLFLALRTKENLYRAADRNEHVKGALVVGMRRPHSPGIDLDTRDTNIRCVHDGGGTDTRVATAALTALLSQCECATERDDHNDQRECF